MISRAASQEIHLLVDSIAGIGEARKVLPGRVEARGLSALPLPNGPSFLSLDAENCPRVDAELPAAEAEHAYRMEHIIKGASSHLVFISPAASRVRLNGHPAPRVAILTERDHLQLDEGLTLHVAIYHRPRVGPPDRELLGRVCPVCTTSFAADTRVYVCHLCGTGLHCEGEEKPVDERLECVALSPSCPSCGGPVVLQQGYSYLPEEVEA